MTANRILLLVLCAACGYLLGSISPSILISRRLGDDIRTKGSGNAGSSNMLRTYGTKIGLLTFFLDFCKGALAMAVGMLLDGEYGPLLAGLGCILGHDWPVFFHFRGGKGVACSVAVYLFAAPWPGLAAALVCLGVICITRYISMGSITLAVVFAAIFLFTQPFFPQGCWALLLMLLCIYRHRNNIRRVLKGTENKLSFHHGDKGKPD